MNEDDEEEQIKEVYARFGLALYHAQALEHSLVNALVILDLIPARRHLTTSAAEWGSLVDGFMDRHFDTTMGRMISSLRSVTTVPDDLEDLLHRSLKKRNWLTHDFFRERALQFINAAGRDQMMAEVEECRSLFQNADYRLEEIVGPLLKAAGISDKMLEEAYQDALTNRHN